MISIPDSAFGANVNHQDNDLRTELRNSDAAVESPAIFHKAEQPHQSLAIAGLFAGIAGFELGFRARGHHTVALCESDFSAQRVLSSHFPDASILDDVRNIKSLPECDVVTAGFPCQDLSQVGSTKGISGANSGLITEVLRLLEKAGHRTKWLILENVPFMLRLQQGRAIREVTGALDRLGWQWAYRIIDTQAFGLPQRRRRLFLLASRSADPRSPLLEEDVGDQELSEGKHACGFYWTEGHRGLGWAIDSIPPLKGGSGLAIPSPPAIWLPDTHQIATPSIEDAERLQGFPARWTEPAVDAKTGNRLRWRLVGNAVSVPVAEWIAARLEATSPYVSLNDTEFSENDVWPDAAYRVNGRMMKAPVSSWPRSIPRVHLEAFLTKELQPLSFRAASGFLARIEHSCLRRDEKFMTDLRKYVAAGSATQRAEDVDPSVSKRMAATRSKNNDFEISLRSILHKQGFRYRIHTKVIKGLRRTADIAFPALKVAIFLDGCFWHGCPIHGTWPKTNAAWWRAKIKANQTRDRDTDKKLKATGWLVIRIWEHENAAVVSKRIIHQLKVRKARLTTVARKSNKRRA